MTKDQTFCTFASTITLSMHTVWIPFILFGGVGGITVCDLLPRVLEAPLHWGTAVATARMSDTMKESSE